MAHIRFISTSTIQPASENQSTHKTELTPWDLSLLPVDYTQRGLLFLNPTPSQNKELKNNVINRLKSSLSLTLDIFPPFAGRLGTIRNYDKTTSFIIDCNGAGAQFVHAVVDGVTSIDILKPVYVPSIVYSFFPMNGVRSCEGISKHLLAVQVTELVDGIFIGCSYNHMVADGSSFWHFVNTWSEISRTSTHVSQPPIIRSWFLEGINYPISIPFAYDEIVSNRFISLPLQERVFHFTKEKIALLKAKANAEIGTNLISSLQALIGHLWLSMIRIKGLNTDQETNCLFLVNMRQRLRPPLPEHYFGNVVHMGTTTTTAEELLKHGLGWAAWQINKMVASQTDEEIRKNLESLVNRLKQSKRGGLASNIIIVASSPRLDVYGNDFGWGRPIAVRGGAGNKFDGRIVVFPGVEEGSVDIQVCLLHETLQAMAIDSEFMEAVST